jgi:sigma-B regulation protein RsbU (phosphoserine phosphatase)
VLFYTDGITEAIDPEGEFYTAPRLRTLLGSLHGRPPEGVVRTVVRDVRAFAGAREQADDLSLLAVQWFGSQGPTPAAVIG